MSVSTVKETMLYCPKCQQTYQDGTQRFCTNEGGRLLPVPSSDKSVNQSGGVFTNLLGRVSPNDEKDKKIFLQPKIVKNEPPPLQLDFSPTLKPRHFPTEQLLNLKPEVAPPPPKPLPRTIKPDEIPASQATLGNRMTNPAGRPALTLTNPDVLLEQTVKGRYFVLEKLGEDETSLAYLAEDKLVAHKKFVVRVLMEEEANDDFTKQIFAEERVSLSLINHPNISRILDSGELPEGKPFIISEYIEGKSVREMLKLTGQFNGLRTARIIRQIAYALSEVHQNGILHRNLKPESIILTVSEVGNEQVKLTNFGNLKGSLKTGNIAYLSPEQIEGNLPTYASDIYSLAVITYQMLTNRLPFNIASAESLLKAQKIGLQLHPTNLRLDLPPLIDVILEKALAFNPSERYPKARDFGDAFFNALTTVSPWENNKTANEIEIITEKNEAAKSNATDSAPVLRSNGTKKEFIKAEPALSSSDIHISPQKSFKNETSETGVVKASNELTWEKRSPEPPKEASSKHTWLAILGLIVLFLGIWALWQYVLNRPTETVYVPPTPETANTAQLPAENVSPLLETIESPILPRNITQPPNTVYFQNEKSKLKGETAKNFLGFSLYYPKDWQQNEIKEEKEKGVRGKFLDISKNAPNKLIIEQMLVSYYNSKGTFKEDYELFPASVRESSEYLKKLPNYQVISQGEETINNGWKTYKVVFQGETTTSGGEKVLIWGKRLWIPAGRTGMKNGYFITMLATSLSPDVKSADDVGVKGDLATVLQTFEPNQNF